MHVFRNSCHGLINCFFRIRFFHSPGYRIICAHLLIKLFAVSRQRINVFIRFKSNCNLKRTSLPCGQKRMNNQIIPGYTARTGRDKRPVHSKHQIRTIPAWRIKTLEHLITKTVLKAAVRINFQIIPRNLIQIDKLISFRITYDNRFRKMIQQHASDINPVLCIRLFPKCLFFRAVHSPNQKLQHFVKT